MTSEETSQWSTLRVFCASSRSGMLGQSSLCSNKHGRLDSTVDGITQRETGRLGSGHVLSREMRVQHPITQIGARLLAIDFLMCIWDRAAPPELPENLERCRQVAQRRMHDFRGCGCRHAHQDSYRARRNARHKQAPEI